MKKAVLHLIATIRYRFGYAITHSNDEYYSLSIGHGVRTPLEIIHHMRGLMYYTLKVFSEKKTDMAEIQNWKIELDQFYKSLDDIELFIKNNIGTEEQYLKIIQGPLSDSLTHIGQLAMLSRLNGQPLDKQNFVHANIK